MKLFVPIVLILAIFILAPIGTHGCSFLDPRQVKLAFIKLKLEWVKHRIALGNEQLNAASPISMTLEEENAILDRIIYLEMKYFRLKRIIADHDEGY